MRVLVPVAVVVVFAMACACAGAVGKVTVDPNASGSVAAQSQDSNDASSTQDVDARLDKKITYSARRKLVYAIVDDLSKLSDVKLYAGRDTGDWRTRDLRVNVIVKDVSLRDVMQSIARVMQFKWNRSSSGEKWVYRLVDPNSDSDKSVEILQARALAERRRKFFIDLMSLARMSGAEIDGLKSGKPELYALAKTTYGVPLARFLADTPVASMALMAGRRVVLRGGDLPLSAMQTLLPAIQGDSASDQPRDAKSPAVMPVIPANANTLSVEINPSAAEKGTSTNLGEVTLACSGRTVPIVFPDSAAKENTSNSDAVARAQAGYAFFLTAPTDPVVQPPDEPDLHNKIKLEAKDQRATLDVVLAALAEASGFAVVSDCYDAPSALLDVPRGELELRVCIANITAVSGQNWGKNGQVLELRSRNWRIKRFLLLPQATLRKWRAMLERDGYLPFQELANIAVLFSEQIDVYVNEENGLPGVAAAVSAGREPLTWFASLDESQQTDALRGGGVKITADALGKLAWANTAILAAKPGILDDPNAEFTLKVSRDAGAKGVSYFIRVMSGGRELAAIRRFASPGTGSPRRAQ